MTDSTEQPSKIATEIASEPADSSEQHPPGREHFAVQTAELKATIAGTSKDLSATSDEASNEAGSSNKTSYPGKAALSVNTYDSVEQVIDGARYTHPQGLRCITILSEQSPLQTELVKSLFESKLTKVACEIVSELSEIPSYTHLLLVDCQGRQQQQLKKLGKPLQELCGERIYTAILNAEQSAAHEDLLNWSCVNGIFYTDTSADQLLRGMEYLLDGDYWVPRRLLHQIFDKHRKPAQSRPRNDDPLHLNLTKREIQIITMIRDGNSNQDISLELDLSEHTIKSHLYNTYRKIGVKNRTEAANWAREITEKSDFLANKDDS